MQLKYVNFENEFLRYFDVKISKEIKTCSSDTLILRVKSWGISASNRLILYFVLWIDCRVVALHRCPILWDTCLMANQKLLYHLTVRNIKVNLYFIMYNFFYISPEKFMCSIVWKPLGYMICKDARKQDIFQWSVSSACQTITYKRNTSICQGHSYDKEIYCISRTIRHTFSPEKCDLNLTCVLYAEGKYLFPNLWMSLHLLYDIFIVK